MRATPLCTIVDGYDPVGNRLTRNLDGNPITWTYDDLYRLTGQQKARQVCTHDAADKITTMIEGANLTTYTWTGFGALASEITGNSTTGYAYSGQDQLIAVTDPSGAKTTYSFDGDGLRRSTLAEDQGQDPPLEMRTTFVWDGSHYLLLNGPSSNTVVLTLDGEIVSAGTFDLLPDSLGSVIGDIRAGQEPRAPFSYWPYGTLLPSPVKPSFPFLYVGTLGYYTDSSDRDYVRARELYKKLGRWMQVDPQWPDQPAFRYCNSEPTHQTDESGARPTRRPRRNRETNGACGVFICRQYGWNNWIVTHEYICVKNPKNGCAGGLYPPHKLDDTSNSCDSNSDSGYPIRCQKISTDCGLGNAVCGCLDHYSENTPNWFLTGLCWNFPNHVLDCACEVLRLTGQPIRPFDCGTLPAMWPPTGAPML